MAEPLGLYQPVSNGDPAYVIAAPERVATEAEPEAACVNPTTPILPNSAARRRKIVENLRIMSLSGRETALWSQLNEHRTTYYKTRQL